MNPYAWLYSAAVLATIQKERNYWSRFFKRFSHFLFNENKYFDQYAGSVFKILKTFFNYLSVEKSLPIGEFHKKFRIPCKYFTPAILSPQQLKFLIASTTFENSLSRSLQRVKDIFVFGCTVGLRFQDLMELKKSNFQYTPEGVALVCLRRKQDDK